MGLDIYLYRYDQPRSVVEKENEAWEAVTSEISDKYEKEYGESAKWTALVNKQWRNAVKKAAKKEGRVGDYDSHPAEVKIQEDSKKYPKHIFKIGYFRSSYNASGINRILHDRIGQNLYSILGITHEDYHQQPDWRAVITRVDSAMEQYEALLNDNPWEVIECSHSIFSNTPTMEDKEALEIAQKELGKKRGDKDFSEYSNSYGFWCPKGMTVYGAINGKDCLGAPTCFLVIKDDGSEDGLRWYLHALEIIKETAEYVLAQKDQSKFWLHVSG